MVNVVFCFFTLHTSHFAFLPLKLIVGMYALCINSFVCACVQMNVNSVRCDSHETFELLCMFIPFYNSLINLFIDPELDRELDYENPNNHGWYAKAVSNRSLGGFSMKRKSSTLSGPAIKYLSELEQKKSNVVPTNHKEVIKIEIDGEPYYFLPGELDETARAINDKVHYIYRTSATGDKVQFFSKKVELTIKEEAVYYYYYNNVYDGRFVPIKMKRTGMIGESVDFCYPLSMFIDGYEFAVSKTRNLYSDILECTYGDCKAYIRQTVTPKGEVHFNWHPHSEEFPHSHSKCTESTCSTIESINVSEITLPSREDDKEEFLRLEDLDDEHFIHDFIPCETNPKQLYHNGFIFTDMSKIRRGASVWTCIKRRNQKFGKCPAKAYGKKIDEKMQFAIDTFHTHE